MRLIFHFYPQPRSLEAHLLQLHLTIRIPKILAVDNIRDTQLDRRAGMLKKHLSRFMRRESCGSDAAASNSSNSGSGTSNSIHGGGQKRQPEQERQAKQAKHTAGSNANALVPAVPSNVPVTTVAPLPIGVERNIGYLCSTIFSIRHSNSNCI